jgi:hypothetical protein
MKKLFLLLALIAASSFGAERKYPNQPSINAALKQLAEAQQKIDTKPSEAGDCLRKASDSLEHAIKDKGTFRVTAKRLTDQATKHLEKGDVETAKHEIEGAIENANKAGRSGGR